MKTLFADDDPCVRTLLTSVLDSLGHSALAASSGSEAWELWQRERPGLAIVDIEMPELDGLTLIRRIREADRARETFLLVLTGRDGPDDLTAVLEAGADDYVTKPATPDNLRARLRIAERRIRDDAARRVTEAELAKARWLAGIGETSIALQHEINNPLSAIMGHAELLSMDLPAGAEQDRVNVILSQARRIADVVRRIAKLREPRTVEYMPGSSMLDLRQPDK